MTLKGMSPDLIGDGHRFSGEVMRNEKWNT
jgi:hypothetical protein